MAWSPVAAAPARPTLPGEDDPWGDDSGEDSPTEEDQARCGISTTGGAAPRHMLWLVTLLVGVGMAFTSWLLFVGDAMIIIPKFKHFQEFIDDAGLGVAVLFLVLVSTAMATVAAFLVAFVHPPSAGSGLPELKGYVNGNKMPGVFGIRRNLLVRWTGAMLATGAGLATGREGPLVSIGGSVGAAIVKQTLGPLYRRMLKDDVRYRQQGVRFMHERRYSELVRVGCVMGGSAGLAAAFNAPVGGILYMLEEVSVGSWSTMMTLRSFSGAVLAALGMRLLMKLKGEDVHSLVIFTKGYDWQHAWEIIDLPFVAINAVVVGALSALYTVCLVKVWQLRNSSKWCRWRQGPRKRLARVGEVAVYAMLSVLVMALMPLLGECTATPDEDHKHGRIFVKYMCDEHEHNEIATMLLQGEEGAVKHLFARDHGGFPDKQLPPLLLTLLVYFPLASGLAGLNLPLGNFIPSMFMGGLVGRILRQVYEKMGFGEGLHLAHPGVYALEGSVAMLAGFTHFTLAITVILSEAAQDISQVAPMMLSVAIGRTISAQLIGHDYNEQLILLKGVPYMEGECPSHMLDPECTAGSVCARLSTEAWLSRTMTTQELGVVLERYPGVKHFPVVDPGTGICAALARRDRLEEAFDDLSNEELSTMGPNREPSIVSDDEEMHAPVQEVSAYTSTQRAGIVPVFALADPVTISVPEDTPVARIYTVLSRADVEAICITVAHLEEMPTSPSLGLRTADLVGVLEREHLVSKGKH